MLKRNRKQSGEVVVMAFFILIFSLFVVAAQDKKAATNAPQSVEMSVEASE